jgi:hypothetical protein
MNIGLPGTGLGGLFYLITALMMPLFELRLTLAGRRSLRRWRIVGLQWGIAAAILVSTWGTFELLAYIFPHFTLHSQAVSSNGGGFAEVRHQTSRALRIAPILISLPTLLTILLSVEALRLVAQRKSS